MVYQDVKLSAREDKGYHVFDVDYLGQGYYRMVNRNYAGFPMTVTAAESKNGTNVHAYGKWDDSNAAWLIEACGDGYYRIISKCNGLCVNLAGAAD